VRPALLWFRLDLRLADHPALAAAVERGGPVVPLFIWTPEEEGEWRPGGASRWWLHQSLVSFAASLEAIGSRLVVRQGPALGVLRSVAREIGADTVVWSERWEPAVRVRDAEVEAALLIDGLTVIRRNSSLLRLPSAVRTGAGGPFQVFTPFWRRCLALPDPAEPLPVPRGLPAPSRWPRSLPIAELGLEPCPDWAGGLRAAWRPGASGARAALDRFLEEAFSDYDEGRDRPDLDGTSRLSPHLHVGELSPQQVWHAVRKKSESLVPRATDWRQGRFLAELGWREFSHHLLAHFPGTAESPLRPEFARFPWRSDPARVEAWQKGRTGYPFVDAGMRQLWSTGWMHNRVRMVVASFLVKDLLISWAEGARWFWDTLVDADLAQNTLGWQWAAGCGADAAPFFRVFNPTVQGEKFDPQGAYVRRWLPELAGVPDEWVHRPAEAPPQVLVRAGVALGRDYPEPMVSHAIAREVALDAYHRFRKRGIPRS
jgi:deoxyribodipyrimidine photo-lyase